jgi:hypothetical protein
MCGVGGGGGDACVELPRGRTALTRQKPEVRPTRLAAHLSHVLPICPTHAPTTHSCTHVRAQHNHAVGRCAARGADGSGPGSPSATAKAAAQCALATHFSASVFVVGIAPSEDSVQPQLRRGGLLSQTVSLARLTAEDRAAILRTVASKCFPHVARDIDWVRAGPCGGVGRSRKRGVCVLVGGHDCRLRLCGGSGSCVHGGHHRGKTDWPRCVSPY